MTFKSLGISATLLEALEKQGFSQPTLVQELAIPEILKHKDVLGIAQTGTGKTASYVLPLLMKVLKSAPYKNRHIKALVLVPTRELAMQVHQVFQLFSSKLERHIKSMAVYGGVSINPQMIGLQNVEILIATPGRLLDLARSKALHFSEVKTLVLDEADKLLNLGFQKEIDEVLRQLPERKQNLLFSATLSENVKDLNQLLLKDPIVINIKPEKTNVDLIKQEAYVVKEEQKGPFLRYLIKSRELKQVLVFTSSADMANKVANKLVKNSVNASPMHGKLSQGARTRALTRFAAKELRVLVATDLLSRGIDLQEMPYVINYELPRSPKDYIHRIGRTGRAGAEGFAVSILTEDDLHHYKVIQKKMGTWVEVQGIEDVDLGGY